MIVLILHFEKKSDSVMFYLDNFCIFLDWTSSELNTDSVSCGAKVCPWTPAEQVCDQYALWK